jgi:hypothetical protein
LKESFLPEHIALAKIHEQLARSWPSLPDHGVRRVSPHRLKSGALPDHILRLGDVGRTLTIRPPHGGKKSKVSRLRIYREPLQADEVLLSTLVTEPRVAFVESEPLVPIHVSDHWLRLRFPDVPGAWALVLETEPVRRQLELMAVGITRQFAPPKTIFERLRLPKLPPEREQWDAKVRELMGSQGELDRRGAELVRRAKELVAGATRGPRLVAG